MNTDRRPAFRSEGQTYSVLKAACTDRLIRSISRKVSSEPWSTRTKHVKSVIKIGPKGRPWRLTFESVPF
jgi:hypothetical protein